MNSRILPLLALLPFAACAQLEGAQEPEATAPAVTEASAPVARPAAAPAATPAPTPAPAPTASPTPPAPPPASAADLAPPPAAETAAEAEDEAPAAPPVAVSAPSGRLGSTVASLGSPTQSGLWLETALVSEPTQGRIEYNGQTVSVQLRPSGGEPGSGSQISLEAMRALGAPLTGLPEITVYGG